MSTDKTFNGRDALRILGAFGVLGAGWIADNESTAVAFLAMAIVYLVGLAFNYRGIKLGKASLTSAIFVVAFVLSIYIKGLQLPVFPVWDGDASAFTPLLIAYVSAVLQSVSGVVAYATGVYNILLAKVLEKMPYAIPSAGLTSLFIFILIVSFVAI